MSDRNRYFTIQEFRDNFGKEIASSQGVFERMVRSGLKEYQFCEFDFNFISDEKEKLTGLSEFLDKHYGYKMEEVKKRDDCWDVWGNARKFPVDKDTILFWALDLYKKGYEYDCVLEGYGATVETDSPEFPDLSREKEGYYFDSGLKEYEMQNIGFAIINWSTAIKINPNDPDSFYSRAVAKNELYAWKAALEDYDKAIELAPEFADAYSNRGAIKDESGDYDGAIDDYNKSIEIKPEKATAYFNRGNSRFNKGDKEGACSDWKKAKELGADYAEERLRHHCM